MEIQNSGGGQLTRSHHCDHGQGADKPGATAVTLQRKLTLQMAAALRKTLATSPGAAPTDSIAAGNPMQSLVTMLQAAVSGSSQGGDPVPDLLSAVRAALSSARDSLTASGVSADDANKAAATVSQQLGQALAPAAASGVADTAATDAPAAIVSTLPSLTDVVTSPATSHSYAATYVRKEKASLDILTQEGDRVQILFRSRQGVAIQSNGAAGSDAANTAANSAGAAPAGSTVYAFASGRVQVAVQGDLSADELKAIGELVGKVDDLAKQFFQGDIQQAFSSAAAIGFDPAQIAGFALKMSLRESFRQSGALPAAASTAPKPITQTTNPSSGTPSTSTSGSGSAVTTDSVAGTAPSATPLKSDAAGAAATTAPASSTNAATTEASAVGTLQSTLAAFVRKVLDGVAQPSGAGRIEFSMRWKLSLVIAAVDAGTPKTTPAGAGTPAAGQSTGGTTTETPISVTPGDPAAASLLSKSLQSAGSLAAANV